METDPWIFAIGSGIAVALATMLLDALRRRGQHDKRRKAYLKAVKHQLENNTKALNELRIDLEGNYMLPDFDVSIIRNFLASDYMDIEKDKEFLEKLQVHLDNIGKYKISVQQLLLYNADFTSVGVEGAKVLKTSLTGLLTNFKKAIDNCITEIDKLI